MNGENQILEALAGEYMHGENPFITTVE